MSGVLRAANLEELAAKEPQYVEAGSGLDCQVNLAAQ